MQKLALRLCPSCTWVKSTLQSKCSKVKCLPILIFSHILRIRSFLCGISSACHFMLSAIASKTYYNIESWLSLPGAILFYGVISLIGYFFFKINLFSEFMAFHVYVFCIRFIVMFFIMPETEQRSLEDIERHYSDNIKGLTDIHIRKHSERLLKIDDVQISENIN